MRAGPALVVPGPSSSPSSAGSQGDAQTTLTVKNAEVGRAALRIMSRPNMCCGKSAAAGDLSFVHEGMDPRLPGSWEALAIQPGIAEQIWGQVDDCLLALKGNRRKVRCQFVGRPRATASPVPAV